MKPLNLRSASVIAPIAVLALTSVSGCGGGETQGKPEAPPRSAQVSLLTVQLQETPSTFETVGTVRARFNAILSSKVLSRVVSVSADEGDVVTQGQPLISLDSRELGAAVDVAGANLKAAKVGVGNAATAANMEEHTSAARIAEAEAQVQQSQAALAAAKSKLDLALAGPRTQEKTQAHLAVVQAESTLRLAKTERDRVARLVEAGAVAQRNLDQAQSALEVAKAQYDTAVQSEKIAQEGTREQDIQTAKQGVTQAEAAVRQAQAGLKQAQASALQVNVRRQEIESAKAQVSQSMAALRSAQVTLAYASVSAPFPGKVVKRFVDSGAMASPGAPLLGVEGGEYRLEASVPESIVRFLKVGGELPVKIDALGDRPLAAKVDEIVPQGDPTSHSFIVKLTMPANPAIKSGMFGRALVQTGTKKSILVPTESTWEREGLHYVFAVNKDGIARLRIVSLGRVSGDRIEVLAGLSPGDRIVVGSRDGVADGMKVLEEGRRSKVEGREADR